MRRTGDGDAVVVEDFAIDYIPHAVFEGRGVSCDLGVGLACVVAGHFHKFPRGIVPNQVGHRVVRGFFRLGERRGVGRVAGYGHRRCIPACERVGVLAVLRLGRIGVRGHGAVRN